MKVIQEELLYSNYVRHKRTQSRIDPHYTHVTEEGINCPACREDLPPLDHDSSQTCPHCNLRMLRQGNCLTCIMKTKGE
jgi:hypothetical protein